MDSMVSSINQATTFPLSIDATSSPSLVVNVGTAIIANSISGRNTSLPFFNNAIPAFTGGTVTFPSTSGGNIVPSTGGTYALTLASNKYCRVLLNLDSSGNIIPIIGGASATLATAPVPTPNPLYMPFGYVNLFNNAGTINNIQQTDITQLESGNNVKNGVAGSSLMTVATKSAVITLPTAFPDTTYQVTAQLYNDIDSHPEIQPVIVTNKTTNTFTATWNAPLDTGNYYLTYTVSGSAVQSSTAPYAAKIALLADIFVGTSTDVSSGYADFSSLQSAINAASAGQKIKIRGNLSITENITLNKRVFIEGNGYDSYINGTFTFTATSHATIKNFRCSTVTLDASSNKNFVSQMFLATSATDNGSGNQITAIVG
jgi:hypothetical protein